MAREDGANVTVEVDDDQLDELFENLDVDATVGYTADYAAYVEFPTEYVGSSPPFEPIYEWVQRKWDDLDGGLKDSVLPDDEDISIQEQQKRVASKIVGAIADDGTDGVFFLNRGFEAGKQAGKQFLKDYAGTDDIEAAEKVVEDTVDFAFGKSQDIVADEATDRGTLLQSGFVIVRKSGTEVFEKEGRG